MKLNFSRKALFHTNTKVCLIYSGQDCSTRISVLLFKKAKELFLIKGRYTYDVHEKCPIFKTFSPLVHLRPKFFHPLDLEHPISNDTSFSPNDTVHVNERNQSKNKTKSHHIQIDHAFYSSI